MGIFCCSIYFIVLYAVTRSLLASKQTFELNCKMDV